MQRQIFRHLFGMGGRFVCLEGRDAWQAVNDALWQESSAPDAEFVWADEPLYLHCTETDAAWSAPSKITRFSEASRRIEQQRLAQLALDETAADLRAAAEEQSLAHLLERMNFHLKEKDIFK